MSIADNLAGPIANTATKAYVKRYDPNKPGFQLIFHKVWNGFLEAINANLEHEVNELKEMLHKLENKIEQMAATHKNEIDALTNKHNAAMTEMAQSYAEKYMKFVEESTKKE